MQVPKPASSIRRHEDRETETGEMVQRLIDPDQPPEPLMLLLHREGGDAKSLGAVDCEVNRKIDQADEPEPRRDKQDKHHCNRKMHKAVRQQWKRPALLHVLADLIHTALQQE